MDEVVSKSGGRQIPALNPSLPPRALGERRYPALLARIRGEREPTPHEVKRVAARMLREIGGTGQRRPDLNTQRTVLRAAKLALTGV